MEKTKNQHYVPRMYIKRFGYGTEDNPRISVLKKQEGVVLHNQNPENFASRRFFYDTTEDVIENISILPSNVNLAAAEIELIGVDKKEYILKNEIDWVKDRYDYIIIDCPPSLSLLTVNAMTTADSVLVPIQCEYYALEGLSQLIHTVNLVKERLNPNLEMEGVVFTMYDSRTNLSAQVVENVKDNLNQTIYKTIIPRNIRLAEAPSHGLPINLYDPKSAGAESYMLLAEEVMNKGEE